MFPSTLSRSVGRAQSAAISRHYSRSVALKAEPKLHNATGKWEQLKSQRPVDEADLHRVFHPPFNRGTILTLVSVILFGGYGIMHYGVVHQQYKQGYWK